METVSNKQNQLHKDATAFYLHATVRQNIVYVPDICREDRVLLVSGQEPAVEEALKRRTRNLTRMDEMDLDASCEGQEYDVILCLAVRPTDTLLSKCHSLLSGSGKLYVAFDNYLQDTDSICETEQERKKQCKSSLQSAKKAMERNGFACKQVWYPYPDWRFAYSVFSDSYLPDARELSTCHNRLDHRKPEQTKMWEQAIADEMFFYLAPAFLLYAKKRRSTESREAGERGYEGFGHEEFGHEEECDMYWRFSGDRKKELAIYTRIARRGEKRFVEKGALFEEGQPHIEHMVSSYEPLRRQYEHDRQAGTDSVICRINVCEMQDNHARFAYVEGRSLEEVVLHLLTEGKISEAKDWITGIANLIQSGENEPFASTQAFSRIFGSYGGVLESMEQKSTKTTNIDPLLSNFLLQGKEITMIDYEWTFSFPIPVKFPVYRMIFYLIHNHPEMEMLMQMNLYEMLGITEEEKEIFAKMEQAFQSFLQGEEKSERSRYEYFLSMTQTNLVRMNNRTQIAYFIDDGNGIMPENEQWIAGNSEKGIQIPVPDVCQKIRLDLSEQPCLICFIDDLPLSQLEGNGFWLSDRQVLFTRPDPQIIGVPTSRGQLCIRFDCYEVPEALMEQMTGVLQKGKEDGERCDYLSEKIAQMEASTSWKVTKPLRKLKGK